MARLWTDKGQTMGALKQGKLKKKKKEVPWTFGLSNFDVQKGDKKNEIESMLEEIKKERTE